MGFIFNYGFFVESNTFFRDDGGCHFEQNVCRVFAVIVSILRIMGYEFYFYSKNS